jgi:YVTN family beta-propeller protein
MAWRSCKCGAFVLLRAHHSHDPAFTSVLVLHSKNVPAFDTATNAVFAIVPVGTGPDGVKVNRAGIFAHVQRQFCPRTRGSATPSRLTLP